jgi:uncharacterized protein YbjT (DUF2867 family)
MEFFSMKAAVVGATGETGQRIVEVLLRRHIEVRAVVRDSDKARQLFPEGVEIVVADVLQPATLNPAIEGCSVVLCATGARPSLDPTQPYRVDFEGTKNLVDVASANGIEQFILVSSLCVSQFFHPLNLFWLILVWKKQAEAYLQRSGLVYTIVRPGGLKNENDTFPIVMKGADRLFEGSIPRAKVADVAVEALFQPTARHKIVEVVTSATQTNAELAELFASVPSL